MRIWRIVLWQSPGHKAAGCLLGGVLLTVSDSLALQLPCDVVGPSCSAGCAAVLASCRAVQAACSDMLCRRLCSLHHCRCCCTGIRWPATVQVLL